MDTRRKLAAALLLLAVSLAPELVWAGTQWLQGHAHGVEAGSIHHHGSADLTGLAEILAHGHEHREGTPDHEHSLLLSSAVRQDAPGSAQVPGVLLETRTGETRSLSAASTAWQLPRLDGPSPPRLHLLCTLLI